MIRALVALLLLACTPAFAATPQPIALPGLYTLVAGPDNLEDNLPANGYAYQIAWAVDRPGSPGYMVSDGSTWRADVGPAGPPGSAGANGNTILSGTGAPSVGSGVNGDYYVDVVATRFYGPKTGGVWGSGVPLVGATGSTGSPGAAATIAVGTVTTLSPGASVSFTNVGTASAAIFDVGIPQGATGATGGAGVNSFGYPTSRSLSLATAYQCTNTAKPCVVTVNLTSSASFSLLGGQTNTADILVGSTSAVASGTGSIVGRYGNSSTAGVAVGIGVATIAGVQVTAFVPVGGYFAVRQTAGTVTITSAFDQAVG